VSDPTVKVLVVAEEALVRRALAMELAACLAGAEVTPAGGDEEATEILRHHPHDVALVDIGAQQGDGIKLLREIRTRWPQMPVILLSDREDGETVRAALTAGAAGYVLKDAAPEDLATAVQVARSGSGNMISLRAARSLSSTGAVTNGRGGSQPAVPAAGLTRREVDVLGLLAEGATNRQISRQLFLSEKTVKAHLASAFRKLLVENRTQAAVAAVAMGIARLVPAKNTRASSYQASPA
jgi:two-component system response regulator DevR